MRGQRIKSDLTGYSTASIQTVTHNTGQKHVTLRIGQAFRNAVAHTGYQRVGGAKVNADGDAPLMRIGRLAGLGYLQ